MNKVFTLNVLNDGDEWETVRRAFPSKWSAMNYYVNTMGGSQVWAGYEVIEMPVHVDRQWTLAELAELTLD
jgi:hypothetical protein